MIKTYKVMLIPNNKQSTRMFGTAGACRFAYNWALAKQKELLENKTIIKDSDIRKQFTQLKRTEEYTWLYNYSNEALKQAIKDACDAYISYIKKLSKEPKFKKKGRCKESFYIDPGKVLFKEDFVKLEKLSLSQRPNKKKFNWVRLAETNRIPLGVKYYNPRVTFDGEHWWISVSVEEDKTPELMTGDPIGLDLGVKTLITCSDGAMYGNICKSHKYKKIEKRRDSLQKVVSKKYETNKRFIKSNNIKKLNLKILRSYRRLNNIKTNYLHQVINDIINRKPRFINIEDLSVKEMLQDRELSKNIADASFYRIRDMLSYKCEISGIDLRIINRYFASSKTCSRCGNIKTNLTLDDRIYKCKCCGLVLDRDYNASINILNYKI